jgi:hypothetical protein
MSRQAKEKVILLDNSCGRNFCADGMDVSYKNVSERQRGD